MTCGPAYHAAAIALMHKLDTEKGKYCQGEAIAVTIERERRYSAYKRGVIDALEAVVHGYRVRYWNDKDMDGWQEVKASSMVKSMIFLETHQTTTIHHNLDTSKLACFEAENIVYDPTSSE